MSQRKKRTARGPSDGVAESRMFKFGTKIGLSLVIMILALTLMQCTVKKPESPTWNTRLVVPLVNRTYDMSEIIEKIDQEGVTLDDNGGVIFSVSEEIDTVTLDSDELATGDLAYQAVQQLGVIDIPAPSVPPVQLSIDMIGGLATYLPGTVPATSFSIVNSLGTIDSYTAAGIISGEAYVVVANNLGFAITADSVELWDIVNNRSVGRHSFPSPISNGGIDSVLYDLSGQTLSNQLEARIISSTLGGTVLSTADKYLMTVIRFENDLTVGSATAQIPALSHSFSQPVALGEADVIYGATLTSGTLQLDIANQTNLSPDIDITFPDLVLSGTPLTVQRSLSPISSSSVTVDLTGYELRPTDSTLPQEIVIQALAAVAGTAPSHVAVDRSDQFIIDAGLSNLTFGSVTGVFGAVNTTLTPTQHDIDVPNGFDSLQLVSAALTLSIENGVELPGNLLITLLGNNGKTLDISGLIAPGTFAAPVVTRIIDTTVADFLSPMPSQITVSGNAGFGDGVSEGSIRAGDYIRADIDILAPVEIIIPRTEVEPDIEAEEIDQEDIDAVTGHIIEAKLIYNVVNHMPIGATVNLFLGPDSATLLSDPEVSFIDDIFVLAAPTLASIASDTISTGFQEVTIDSADVHVLEHDTLYIATQIILEDSNGLPVKLTANDYLTVTGRVEVEYRFDGDF